MAKYTSSSGNFKVATLQNKTRSTYQENLKNLMQHIENSEAELIVAPELCLTNFDYEHFDEAAAFYDRALTELLAVVSSQIVVLTMTVKEGGNFYNRAVVIYEHKVLHRQEKYKLFKLGKEEQYFKAGSRKDIIPFEINKVKYAILICFELRFKELWQQIEGVDVVLVPARWGLSRKKHLDILVEALAIVNQTFVVVSNSDDEDMAASSAIISPWGERYASETSERFEKSIELQDVKRVRRLIQMR